MERGGPSDRPVPRVLLADADRGAKCGAVGIGLNVVPSGGADGAGLAFARTTCAGVGACAGSKQHPMRDGTDQTRKKRLFGR
jgi:hypothetical protein